MAQASAMGLGFLIARAGAAAAAALAFGIFCAGAPAAEPRAWRDASYAADPAAASPLQKLDLFAPAGEGPFPVMVFIHGGGWRAGDKRRGGLKPEAFTSAGYLYATVNYRLSPDVVHPAHVQDVASALAWIHKHIARYGGDPKRIFVMGHSAGAHLAALVATDERRLKAAGADLSILSGAILLDGAGYNIPRQIKLGGRVEDLYSAAFGTDPAGWRDASPVEHVASGKGIPPFLIVHAGERAASRIQAENLAEALRAAGGKAEVFHAAGHNHGSVNRDIGLPNDATTKRVFEFLKSADSR